MTRDDWLKQITADPKDAATQLLFAEWLRDEGDDDTAFAWEWMARSRKWPGGVDKSPGPRHVWVWFNAAMYQSICYANDCDLLGGILLENVRMLSPAVLYVETDEDNGVAWWIDFRTLPDAVAALAAGLKACGVTLEEVRAA